MSAGGPGLSPGLGLADGGAVGVGNVREPTTSALRVRAPEAGRGPPLRGALRGAGRVTAEAKGRHFGRTGRIEEEGRDCPAPPAPHLHGRDRRVWVGSAGEFSTIAAPSTTALLPSGRRY